MKINNIVVPNEAIDETLQEGADNIIGMYAQLEFNRKLAIKTLARTLLVPIISSALDQPLPSKETDPVVWLMTMSTVIVKELYEHLEIDATIDNNSITSINVSISGEGESGRQLVTSWTKG